MRGRQINEKYLKKDIAHTGIRNVK